MKITAVETVVPEIAVKRAFTFVLVHTDEGIVGLGQTADVRTVGVIHDFADRFLIGKDPLRVKDLWDQMFEAAAYHGYAGAEVRAISSLDIALWDICGQAYGEPIVNLMGGPINDSVPIYNTSGSYGRFSDARRVTDDPVELARELLAQGVTCMKWAPFDKYAPASHGQRISRGQLAEGISGIEKVAAEFGNRMEVMVEAHGLWSPGCAMQIAQALEGLPVAWLEDPTAQDNPEAWAQVRAKSPVPIAGGERLLTRHQLRRLVEIGGVDVVISDVTWAGGITESVRIAEMADLFGVSFATHGNSGPVNLWAAAHTACGVRNAFAVETVRVYHDPQDGYYRTLVDGADILERGRVLAPTAAGLGITLREDFAVVERRTSGAAVR
jgi:galactonate dehydratase